jgi:filamentous hemagglutinin family protein
MGYQNQQHNPKFLIQQLANSSILLGLMATVGIQGVYAQSITPASDSTGTIINNNGSNPNQFNISGGTQSGANLFHSFQQFGLNQNQIANFLSHPNIQNILGRITGGDASIINGLIQITGSNANLYLMNPAGIIFGNNASLNIPAAFTATTANAIGFGNNQWFKAFGNNNYANLVGNPAQFAFLNNQAGSIFNAGTLEVGQGSQLTLLGGTVVNTGTLSAPGGTINIVAVPGEKLVRVSPFGNILSLDLPLQMKAAITENSAAITPLSLPALLTGGNLVNATGITVENGVVKLTNSDTIIPTTPGTTIVSGQVSVANTSGLRTPKINILGEQVGLIGATIEASSNNRGGTILIGGDYLGQGKVPNAQSTFVDANTQINADALVRGNGGKVIVWADDTTRFQGRITARGNGTGNGGFVETSGARSLNIDYAAVDASARSGKPGVWLLDPGNINLSNAATTVGILPIFAPGNLNSNVNVNAIANTLNNGTSVTITTAGASAGFGDITLTDSITKTAANNASLTLTGRRFIRPGAATIDLSGGGDLTFNINQVNPEANAPGSSIQNAINAIGNVAGNRTINLGAGTYTGGIEINKSLTINGVDATNTIVSGGNISRVFFISDGTVLLNNLTVANGNLDGNGGGILNNSNLTVNNSIISDNATSLSGGGIRNNGNLTLNNSTVSGNSANGDGGGILNYGNNLIVNNSTISGNFAVYGGGINNYGSATISNSTISNNSAFYGGGILSNARGALDNAGGIPNGLGVLTVRNSTISGNSAQSASGDGGGILNYGNELIVNNSTISGNFAVYGGGINNYGSATISNSTISGNSAQNGGGILSNAGGALDNAGGIPNGLGVLTVSSSTISGNSAQNGGGIYNYGTATINNSTLNGNLASDGGGIANGGILTLSNSTLSGNLANGNLGSGSGGGIATTGIVTVINSTVTGNSATNGGGIWQSGNTMTVSNSIIAGNTAPSNPELINNGGAFTSGGNNLVGQNGNAGGFEAIASDIILARSINTTLAPLGNYGGTTQTHALLPGSPAINAAGTNAPTTDQRGIARIGAPDIGAFESRGFIITANPPQSTVVNTAFATPPTATVSSLFGEPVAGGIITYTAPTTGASAILSRNTTIINARGQASIPATANTIAGSYTVAAGGNGILIPANLSLTNDPADASRFSLAGFPSPTTAGNSQTFTVTAFDAFDNLATNYTGTINFSSDDTQAVLPGLSNLSNGTGTFTGELRTAGTRSLIATDTTIPNLTGRQNNIIVNPAATSIFTSVSGFPSPTTAGVFQSFTVTARDAFGNITPNYLGSINFSSDDAQATLPGLSNLSNGTGTFTGALRTAGRRSITATDSINPSITATQTNIIVNPAAASQFIITNFPSPTTAGVPQTFTVSAFDPFNNLATNYTGTIGFRSDDAQAVLPGQSNLTAGTGSFTGELRTAGVRSLTATDTTTPNLTATQSNIIVNPAAAANIISINGNPQSTTVNTTFNIPLQVQVTDAFNNPIPNTNVSFTAPTSGAGANFSNSNIVTTNPQGIATAPTLTANDVAGTYRIITSSDRIILTPFTLTNQPVITPTPIPQPTPPTITPQPAINQPTTTPQPTQPTTTATQTQPVPDWEGKPPEGLEVKLGENTSPILCVSRRREREKFDEYPGLPECFNRQLLEPVEK